MVACNLKNLLTIKNKEKVCKEIEILKSVNHNNILKMITHWYNKEKKEIIIITEIMSYTLKKFIRPNFLEKKLQ